MNKLLFLFISILLVSCEARLDDDKRAFFTSKIVDANGQPLADASVEVTTYRTFDFLLSSQAEFKTSAPNRDFILGTGTTDENGVVSFTMLFDTAFRYYVTIEGNGDLRKIIEVGQESFNDNLTLDIPLIAIKEIADVELEFINTSGTSDIYEVTVNYFALYCDEYYENNSFVFNEQCALQDEIQSSFNENPNDGLFEFEAFYPSTVEVVYRDASGNDMTQQFAITNPTERYEINY